MPDFVRRQFREALATLRRHDVEFIVVGGVSAAIQGSGLTTFDLYIVHQRAPPNIAKLLSALQEIHGCYRLKLEVRPTANHLESSGHHLLMTDLGPLDVLGTIGHGWDYERLLPFTKIVSLREGIEARILDLAKLIEVKEETATEKDRAMLPILKQTVRNRER